VLGEISVDDGLQVGDRAKDAAADALADQLCATRCAEIDPPRRAQCAPALHAQRHRYSEFIRFLSAVEREVPAGKLIHAMLYNSTKARMVDPMGESTSAPLRRDFDRRLKLECHGSVIASWTYYRLDWHGR
jgi:hypothetical protein